MALNFDLLHLQIFHLISNYISKSYLVFSRLTIQAFLLEMVLCKDFGNTDTAREALLGVPLKLLA